MEYVTIITNVITGVVWGLVSGVIVLLLAWLLYFKDFKHTFVARKLVSDKTIISIRKFKFKNDVGGRELIVFRNKLFGHKNYKVPQQSAQDINDKGKIWVESYYIDGEGFTYADFPSKKDGKINPLTTEDRDFMMSEFEKAERRIGFKLAQHIPTIASLAVVLIIFVLLLTNWEAIAKPSLDMAKEVNNNQGIQLEMLKVIKEIDSNIQTVNIDYPKNGT